MDKEEIIERLEEIAKHAVHVLGEEPFFMSLDDGIAIHEAIDILKSAEPEPLSDAYMEAVWTWLLDYQIKAAELKGRYTPYEVLSWVVNDWRKEHE